MPISSDQFRTALAKFASGVTIVTTKDIEGNLHGMTVSAFCSLSLNPPLILICIEKNAACHFAIGNSGTFVINILSDDQVNYSNNFALSVPDKFDGLRYREGNDGVPVLDGALANLECKLVNTHENGDHTIFVGQVESSSVQTGGKPLLYFDGIYRSVGEIVD